MINIDNNIKNLFLDQLPERCVRTDVAQYFSEPRGLFLGAGGVVLAPDCVEDVAKIVQISAQNQLPIVPFGGGTGLVGGQVNPDRKSVVVSLERMNRVRHIYADENVMVVEAGATLENVVNAAAEARRLFPLALASQGSCRIGGCLATNAGGVNVLRYGNARDLCLGVEAVLPDGSIYQGLKRLRKDNTGLDLRHLLCGSEGSLGIITAASLRLFAQPRARAVALISVNQPADALQLLNLGQAQMGSIISAFELIKDVGFSFLAEHHLGAVPFQSIPPWSVLIEIEGDAEDALQEELVQFFQVALAKRLVSDGVISQSETQFRALWALRENIPVANRKVGAISSHDISLPLSKIAEFLPKADAALAEIGDFRVNAFGHLGDGNLHYNVFAHANARREDFLHLRQEICGCVYQMVADFGGSFSAEHGVGRLKTGELQQFGDPAGLRAMVQIKQALDPQNIMNPGVLVEL